MVEEEALPPGTLCAGRPSFSSGSGNVLSTPGRCEAIMSAAGENTIEISKLFKLIMRATIQKHTLAFAYFLWRESYLRREPP